MRTPLLENKDVTKRKGGKQKLEKLKKEAFSQMILILKIINLARHSQSFYYYYFKRHSTNDNNSVLLN